MKRQFTKSGDATVLGDTPRRVFAKASTDVDDCPAPKRRREFDTPLDKLPRTFAKAADASSTAPAPKQFFLKGAGAAADASPPPPKTFVRSEASAPVRRPSAQVGAGTLRFEKSSSSSGVSSGGNRGGGKVFSKAAVDYGVAQPMVFPAQEASPCPSRPVSPVPSGVAVAGVALSNKVEKAYRRGEDTVDPSMVRPLSVLKKAVENVREKTKGKEEGCEVTYQWARSQLMAVRQDLLVLGEGEGEGGAEGRVFAWEVYETCVESALQFGDLGEVAKCLAKLRLIEQALEHDGVEERRRMLSMSLRILFNCLKRNTMQLHQDLAAITAAHRRHGCIKHALSTVTVLSSQNLGLLRKLIPLSPPLGRMLFDNFLPQLRGEAYRLHLQGYQSLRLEDLAKFLYFPAAATDEAERAAFLAFLEKRKAAVSAAGLTRGVSGATDLRASLDCRASLLALNRLDAENFNPQFEDVVLTERTKAKEAAAACYS